MYIQFSTAIILFLNPSRQRSILTQKHVSAAKQWILYTRSPAHDGRGIMLSAFRMS